METFWKFAKMLEEFQYFQERPLQPVEIPVCKWSIFIGQFLNIFNY